MIQLIRQSQLTLCCRQNLLRLLCQYHLVIQWNLVCRLNLLRQWNQENPHFLDCLDYRLIRRNLGHQLIRLNLRCQSSQLN